IHERRARPGPVAGALRLRLHLRERGPAAAGARAAGGRRHAGLGPPARIDRARLAAALRWIAPVLGRTALVLGRIALVLGRIALALRRIALALRRIALALRRSAPGSRAARRPAPRTPPACRS